jgi:hypothetical protein
VGELSRVGANLLHVGARRLSLVGARDSSRVGARGLTIVGARGLSLVGARRLTLVGARDYRGSMQGKLSRVGARGGWRVSVRSS